MTSTARRTVPLDASTRFRAPTYVRNVIERGRLLTMLRARAGPSARRHPRTRGLRQDDPGRAVAAGAAGGGRARRLARPAPRRQRPALVPLATCSSRCAGRSRQAEDAIGELKDLIEQSAEDMQRYTLSALLELIARHDGRFVLTFDDWHLIDDAAGAPRAGAPARLRAAQPVADPHQPHPAAAAAVAAAGAPPAHRGRRRHPAVRPRRDPRVPRRPERPAAGRRRRRAALRGHRRLGRRPAARVALAARLRRSAG